MSREDLICPICLEFPHNAVLLKCTYFEKGCRPFICDAPQTLSNCLEQFKIAHGMQGSMELSENRMLISSESNQSTSTISNGQFKCPLCRGDVVECVVVEETRGYLNKKMRTCQDSMCSYSGNYIELRKHTKQCHSHANANAVDPIKLSEWEYLQQSSELRDVLSTIHSEVLSGAILGDYVVEYGDGEAADEYADFPGDEGESWTSGLLNEILNGFNTPRNQRITRMPERISTYRRQDSVTSHVDDDRTSYVHTEDDGINDSAVTIPSNASVRRTSSPSNHSIKKHEICFEAKWDSIGEM